MATWRVLPPGAVRSLGFWLIWPTVGVGVSWIAPASRVAAWVGVAGVALGLLGVVGWVLRYLSWWY